MYLEWNQKSLDIFPVSASLQHLGTYLKNKLQGTYLTAT